jgi:hypothetical protein
MAAAKDNNLSDIIRDFKNLLPNKQSKPFN